jgi:CheY-like chemotaxis protein/nitrogen-specific signal transduction histidine kinase
VAEENEERSAQLAHELAEARDRAEEATRLKDEFLATVGHELRTPLSAILGWGRLLQTGKLDAAKSAAATDSIVRNAQAQSQIIDDLLDVSRIISGHMRVDLEVIDIAAVMNSAANVIRGAAEAKGVTLRMEIDPEAGVIRGDSTRLHQVVWNLLSNAVKFTPAGGSITLSLRRTRKRIQIRVVDTGQGIAPEFLPYVFDRFSQQEGAQSRTVGGLGLGLSIAKHLVELHGGTLTADSKGAGRGATFSIDLPTLATPSTAPPVDRLAVPDRGIEYPRELRGLTVLVVDDEEDTRLVLESVLEDGGARVVLASSGAEALDLIPTERPDVIVSDIGMPGMDGYAFVQALRQLPRHEGGHTPAIALTAYARAEDRRRALLVGFQNHAAKPLDPQEMVMVVANAVGRVA